jgi:2'-5' RNA ligase
MPRLFVAIDLPEQVKDDLALFAPELPVARWVPAEQLHLTLRFIGDVGPQTFSTIKERVSGLLFQRFPLAMRGVGHFPPRKRPRVLWVGVDPCDSLMLLQQELEKALAETGLPPEERRFSPHITIARLKETPPTAVSTFEVRHRDLACAPFEVREIILYSSVLTTQGAIHCREAAVTCQDGPLTPS